MDERPIVYLGPSLARARAEQILAADFRPPVRRGDLPQRYRGTIVIIDGEFAQSLSVSPNEILRLLDGGTRIIGAASMGALRAAELHPFGMEGYGWVFEGYRSGALTADDEVAVTYSPLDGRPLTIPLVTVRVWLERLVAREQIEAATARRFLARARAIFYADRTPARLASLWLALTPRTDLAAGWCDPERIEDIKAEDAELALRQVDRAPAMHT